MTLINAGADVRAKTIYQESALKIAVTSGITRVVRLMLDQGCNVNEIDNRGVPLLHHSIYERDHPKAMSNAMFQLLVRKGANINTASPSGKYSCLFSLLKKLSRESSYLLTTLHKSSYVND